MRDTEANTEQSTWNITADRETFSDPLLGCLEHLSRHYDRPKSADALMAGLPAEGNLLDPDGFIRAAKRIGLSTRLQRKPLAQITPLMLPVVLLLNESDACVLQEINTQDGTVTLIQPESSGKVTLPLDEISTRYSGAALFTRLEHTFSRAVTGRPYHAGGHWFWSAIGGVRGLYSEVALATLMVNLFALAVPLFIMNVYDRVVPNRAIETLWVLAAGIGIVFLFSLLMSILRGYFIDVAARKSDQEISGRIHEQLLSSKLGARRGVSGAFVNHMQEFDRFREFFTSSTLTTLIDLPFLFLFIGIIAFIGGPLGWIPFAAIPLVLLIGLIVQRPLRRLVDESFEEAAKKHATLFEALTGLENVKTVQAEGVLLKQLDEQVARLSDNSVSSRMITSVATNLTKFIQQLVTVLIVIGGVYLIDEGKLTVGGLIACTLLAGRAMAPLGQLTAIFTRFHQSLAAYKSLSGIMATEVERPADKTFLHRPELKGDLAFEKVSFTYPDQPIQALSDVSFRIAAGERVAIIGRNGAGKTTVERMLLSLYEPESGNVLADGTDLRQIDPADLRRNIGYVPQEAVLFNLSIRDNMVLGIPFVDDSAILRAAQLTGIDEMVARHPHGYDLRVGERGGNLSGGQRQAVNIARALVNNPQILIMDEPTSAMDNTAEGRFKKRLMEILPGKTFILVTHKGSMLELVDRIIMLDGGKVVIDGPKEQVIQALAEGKVGAIR